MPLATHRSSDDLVRYDDSPATAMAKLLKQTSTTKTGSRQVSRRTATSFRKRVRKAKR